MDQNQKNAKEWFLMLRNNLVHGLEKIENKKFSFKPGNIKDGTKDTRSTNE